MPHGLRRAVFLDRDGTINEEVEYLGDPERLVLLAGVAQGIALLKQAGYLIVVVTNQAGIARGYYDLAAMQAVHERMTRELALQGAAPDAFYFCPHHPDFTGPCDCRKPAPGMLLRASSELSIDLRCSWLVGDTATDIGAGIAAGCKTVLVRTGYGARHEGDASLWRSYKPDYVASQLSAAAALIVRLSPADRWKG